jgi:predicted SnoaL-like aldol condensation-catalyzing enzyme
VNNRKWQIGLLVAFGCVLLAPERGQTAERNASGAIVEEQAATAAKQDSDLERNKQLMRTVVEQFLNKHDVTAVDRHYHAGYIQHNPQAPPGRDGVKTFFSQLFTAFPDLHATVDHLYAEGDRVFAFMTWKATHKADFFDLKASGQPIVIHTAEIFRVQDGRLVEHWDTVDMSDVVVKSAKAAAGRR